MGGPFCGGGRGFPSAREDVAAQRVATKKTAVWCRLLLSHGSIEFKGDGTRGPRPARRAGWGAALYLLHREQLNAARNHDHDPFCARMPRQASRMTCGASSLELAGEVPQRPNDPSSATRPAGRHDCNSDAMAGFAAAHG